MYIIVNVYKGGISFHREKHLFVYNILFIISFSLSNDTFLLNYGFFFQYSFILVWIEQTKLNK